MGSRGDKMTRCGCSFCHLVILSKPSARRVSVVVAGAAGAGAGGVNAGSNRGRFAPGGGEPPGCCRRSGRAHIGGNRPARRPYRPVPAPTPHVIVAVAQAGTYG